MATAPPSRLISHQDYSSYESERRIIEVSSKDDETPMITHFVEFRITGQECFFANVQHRMPNLKMTKQLEVPEERIFYVSDRSWITHDFERPPEKAVALSTLERQKIIEMLYDRILTIADIWLDHLHYENMASNASQSLKRLLTNRSYIVLAPVDDRKATPESFEKSPPPLRLSISYSTPTAHQEIPSL